MIQMPDWDEPCILVVEGEDRAGTLAELVLAATWKAPEDRPECLIVSKALGELDIEQIQGLRDRPDFPEIS